MKIPSFKRLFEKDFPEEQQELIASLAESYNPTIEVLYQLANKKISFADNINCTLRDVEMTVDASGKPSNGTGMTLDSTNRVIGLQVISAENLSNSAVYPTGCPFISFSTTQTGIIFNNITGLQAGHRYRIRVIAIQA